MKKQIPFAMLEAIQPLIDSVIKDGLAKQITIDGKIACFVDADEYDKSDFHFYVSKADNQHKYRIDYKPYNEQNNIANVVSVELKDVLTLVLDSYQVPANYRIPILSKVVK